MKRLAITIFLLFPIFCNLQAQNDADSVVEIATDRLGFEMVYVPSGTVEMGIDIDLFTDLVTTGIFSEGSGINTIANQGYYGVFETYETTLQGFWMDRYEVTANQYETSYQRCVDMGNCSNSNLPQLLTWTEALAFCVARGARLPTEEEWEYAASGPDNFIFPWGNEFNSEFLDNPDYLSFELYDVGSRSFNVSWAGLYDMAGNAAEWTDDLFQPYYSWDETEFTDWVESRTEFSRVQRGGEAVDSILRKTTYSRQAGFRDEQGFRCVRFSDPQNG
ncbi:MAG: SUMF1/EgtB/PvdO family nonheme iron enzyme [Aggregatilineales bacterium]